MSNLIMDQEILQELKNISQKLDKFNSLSRKMYGSFFAGMMQSLGYMLGWVLALFIGIYLISLLKIDLIGLSSKLIEQSFSRINWQKIIPTPKVLEIPSNFNLKDLGI